LMVDLEVGGKNVMVVTGLMVDRVVVWRGIGVAILLLDLVLRAKGVMVVSGDSFNSKFVGKNMPNLFIIRPN